MWNKIIELERYRVKSIKDNNKFVFCLKYRDGYSEFLEYLKKFGFFKVYIRVVVLS